MRTLKSIKSPVKCGELAENGVTKEQKVSERGETGSETKLGKTTYSQR